MMRRLALWLCLVMAATSAQAWDPSKAARYPSPDLHRPNVDRLTINGSGSTGDVSAMTATPDAGKPTGTLGRLTADAGALPATVTSGRLSASYDAALAQIQAKRAAGTRWGQTPNGLIDAYQDWSGIGSASSLYVRDVRHLVAPDRAYSTNIARDGFDSLAAWTTAVSATVVNPNDPDPEVGNAVQIETGANLGNQAVVSRDVGSIPANFGVMAMVRLNAVGTNPADALAMQVANVNGHILKIRFYDGAIDLFADGGWHRLFNHGGNYVTEWWFEVHWNNTSNYSVRLFAGTQELPGYTGYLPGGGTDGVTTFIQSSGATVGRISQLVEIQIGTSALPANMSVYSVGRPLPAAPARAWFAMVLEDVCLETAPNVDVTVSLSRNGGTTWEPVTLAKVATTGVGIIDDTKPVYLLVGTVTFSGTPDSANTLESVIKSANGHYFTVHGIAFGAY